MGRAVLLIYNCFLALGIEAKIFFHGLIICNSFSHLTEVGLTLRKYKKRNAETTGTTTAKDPKIWH